MQIAEILTALYPNAPVIEMRIFFNDSTRVDSGYFNDYDALQKATRNYNGINNYYYTINPCKPDLIARASNRMRERAKQTTADHDIARRLYLPIDLDPVRPSGISATDKEHNQALHKAQEVKTYLTDQGWPKPIELDSGNGAYLEYAIDLPNDPDSTELIKRCLQALDMLFSDPNVKVDTMMFNAARIVRLPGTKNAKGDSTEERPHRFAKLLSVPGQAPTPVDRALLEKLAASLPTPPKPSEIAPKLDFELWLAQEQIAIVRKERYANIATMYILAQCAFNADHKNAALFVFDNGGYDYKCFHDSCSKKRWKDFKALHKLPEDTTKTPSAKMLQQLHSLGYHFRLNRCADRIEVNGVAITDALAHKIQVQMYDKGVKPVKMIESVIHANAFDNSYHPVQDYLNALVWQDTDRDYIRELSTHLYDVHDLIDGERVAYVWLKHWLIGNVAKVFEAEQNPMLVLAGAQGIGKSKFARWLASGLPHFFLESGVHPERADDQLRLITSWIWEVAELGATTRRADIEALKAFITMQAVTVRRPYGHYDMHKLAMASFIGTVNPDGAGFLVDTSGNRRFLTMELTKIDWRAYTQIPVNQVWAQAVALYRSGYQWRLQVDETEAQNEINRRYEVIDPYRELLIALFDIEPQNQSYFLPTQRILAILQERASLRGDLKRQAMDLSRAANSLQLLKGKQDGLNGYYGIRAKEAVTFTFMRKVDKLQ